MEKLKEIYLQYKFLLWPLLSGLSSLIILGVVVVPQLLAYITDQKKLGDLHNQTFTLEARAQELNNIDEAATKQNLQVVFTILPKYPDPPAAMNTLQDLIRKSGLTLKDSSFVGNASSSDKGTYQINITVNGPVNQVRQFLINLQSAPLIYQVNSIGIHFQGGNSAVEAELPISIYYQNTTVKGQSLDQPVPKLTDQEKKLLSDLTNLVPPALASETAPITTGQSSGNLPQVPLGKDNPFQ